MSTDLAVVLQSIKVKDDNDGWSKGAGDIYINYNANDGINHASGQLGEYSINSGQTKSLGVTVATFDDVDTLVALNIDVFDADWPDADDYMGSINVSYDAWDNFGIGEHTIQSEDYNLTFSIVTV